ncbi:CvpA family protein [Amylibacter sp.]|nr:CvpA family protein [Amylibacter sp.]
MDSFTLVDGASIAILLISAILAYSRGLTRELLSIAGWIAAAVSAFIFAPSVEPLIREIPIIRDIVGSRCELSIIAAFAAVFALTLAVVAIFTPLFSGIIQRSILSSFDQSLGFLFGAVRGLILVLVALVVYNFIGADLDIIENSTTKKILAGSETYMQNAIEKDGDAGKASLASWMQNRYEELTTSCN